MSKKRKSCQECPWKNKNEHSLRFRQWSEKIKTVKDIPHHKCHMISADVWGQKSPITDKNICVGKQDVFNRAKFEVNINFF